MGNKTLHYVLIAVAAIMFGGCSVSKNALLHYYRQNQQTLDSIEASYKQLYAQKPFSIGFSDKYFNYVSVTIVTDSLQYIYEFGPDEEQRLKDTLIKYQLNPVVIITLIRQMHAIHCTWINSVDYYVNNKQMFMVFLSARAVKINTPFTYKRYYILAYFPEPQFFDDEGRLYASRRKRKLRKINNEVYSKINDRVCYTISEDFR
jgi:hypothetical protein